MRKTAAAITLITALLITAIAGTFLVRLGKANPYMHDSVKEGEVPPPNGTKPPEILVFIPTSNTAYPSRNISLTFNVTVPKPDNATLPLSELSYKGSWQSEKTTINIDSLYRRHNNTFPFNVAANLTDVPQGPHWLTINATATGFGGWTKIVYDHNVFGFPVAHHYYVTYSLTTQAMVNFAIDTTAPKGSILTSQNKTYRSPDVSLNFAVNEESSQAAYSLDCGENVTVSGNSTLPTLPVGLHNVTVYAWDAAGNVGASETVFFTLAEPESFPTVPVAAVSAASIAAVAAGLLLHNRKRRREAAWA